MAFSMLRNCYVIAAWVDYHVSVAPDLYSNMTGSETVTHVVHFQFLNALHSFVLILD